MNCYTIMSLVVLAEQCDQLSRTKRVNVCCLQNVQDLVRHLVAIFVAAWLVWLLPLARPILWPCLVQDQPSKYQPVTTGEFVFIHCYRGKMSSWVFSVGHTLQFQCAVRPLEKILRRRVLPRGAAPPTCWVTGNPALTGG